MEVKSKVFDLLIQMEDSRTTYILKSEATKTLILIDPELEIENKNELDDLLKSLNFENLKIISLNNENCSPKDFEYEELGNLGICKINIGKFPRTNTHFSQTHILTLTDTSEGSNALPVMFVGEYFNFWNMEDRSIPEIESYFFSVQKLFRGFYDEQIVLTSDTENNRLKNFDFFEKIARDKFLIQQLRNKKPPIALLEHRVANPLFFMKPENFSHIFDSKFNQIQIFKLLCNIKKLL